MNERGGVPVEEVTAQDFMMIRAALVRRVEGANEALVWTRIHFRCSPGSGSSYQHEESPGWWWPASYPLIAEETGLSPKQVRTAAERLIRDGFLEAEKHHLNSAYDQRLSYRTVLASPGNSLMPSRAGGSEKGTSHLPSGSDVPSIEEEKTIRPSDTDRFPEFWAIWPKKEARKTAVAAFGRAVKRADVEEILRAARVFVAVRDPKFLPHAATWLNGDRWEDEVEAPVGVAVSSAAETWGAGNEWMEFNR